MAGVTLRGARYLRGGAEGLARFVIDTLPTLDLDETLGSTALSVQSQRL